MNCGYCCRPLEPGKGRCRTCGRWFFGDPPPPPKAPIIRLSDVPDDTLTRLCSGDWWGKLLGGGFVRGCVYLIGGEPGGGKSTISLQIADSIAEETGEDVLYLPTEEKVSSIRGRASRLKCRHIDSIIVPDVPLTTDLEFLDAIEPVPFIILDSLPDLVGRDDNEAVAVCKRLSEYAQATDAIIFVLDHVTKGEELAGLLRLQHAVDCTIYLRAISKSKKRIWETIKNRHGEGFVTRELIMTRRGLILAPLTDEEIEHEPGLDEEPDDRAPSAPELPQTEDDEEEADDGADEEVEDETEEEPDEVEEVVDEGLGGDSNNPLCEAVP